MGGCGKLPGSHGGGYIWNSEREKGKEKHQGQERRESNTDGREISPGNRGIAEAWELDRWLDCTLVLTIPYMSAFELPTSDSQIIF